MNLLQISWANLRSRPLNTLLSLILLAFGTGIISLLLLLEKQLREQFDRNIKDIDVVIGAKGSPLQLILANVYHIDAPTGNISVTEAEKILNNRFLKLYIESAIPLAYGDNFEKWRIVGTDSTYPAHYDCEVRSGRLFNKAFEATIGSRVAAETHLSIGDHFLSTHGLDQEAEEGHVHEIQFTVVGIFEESNSVIDNLILTPVESVWLVHESHDHEGEGHEEHDHEGEEHDHEGHEHEGEEHHNDGHEHVHDDHTHESDAHSQEEQDKSDEAGVEQPSREVTAYLLKERSGKDKDNKGHKASVLQSMLPNLIRDSNLQSAQPAIEINRLTQNFGIGMGMLTAVALLIMALSFVSVFISLYNSLKDRRYELALMRTMGGTRGTLFRLILQEGLLLTFLGFLLGLLLSRIGLLSLAAAIKENFHYSLSQVGIIGPEWIMLGLTLLVGVLASLLPAYRAIKIDISKTLADG